MKPHILLVDDDPVNLESTKELLETWGYRVESVETPSEALARIREGKEYAVFLLDYIMPSMTGVQLTEEIRKLKDEAIILIYSCDGTREAIKESLRAKVRAFIDKDEDLNKLKEHIREAYAEYEVKRTFILQEEIATRETLVALGMIGISPSIERVANLVRTFKTMDAPVLITGETGTGKELVARGLHDPSKGQIIVVNCAAFANSSLVESELFGYEKGAFTGAMARKVGILEIANAGTVFLDELHHLSLSAQAGLLRAIREKKIRRVGGSEEITIRCRVIAATKPDIHEKASRGDFLPDLYYRLKMLLIEIPALRDRREDIPVLIQHFTNQFNEKQTNKKKFLLNTVRQLEEYSWPGNIGELQGLVLSLLAICDKPSIEPTDLESLRLETANANSGITGLTLAMFDAKQSSERLRFVETTLKNSSSHRQAARTLDVSDSTLRGITSRYEITRV